MSVECAVWSFKRPLERKASLVDAASQRECVVMLIDNNSAASSQKAMHAQAWMVQGSCKFYRCDRCFFNTVTLKLPPHLVRVLSGAGAVFF